MSSGVALRRQTLFEGPPAPPTAGDAERGGENPYSTPGGGLTLGRWLHGTWEGLEIEGTAECPVCRGRMRRSGFAALCEGCGSSLS